MLSGRIRLCVDVRGNKLKYMQGSFKNGKMKIRKFGTLTFSSDNIKEGMIENTEQTALILKNFIKHENIRSKKVYINISDPSIIVRIVRVPLMPERDLNDYLKLEIGQFLPVDLATHVYDYKVMSRIEEDDKQFLNLLLTAVPKNLMENYLQLFKVAGLKPVVMDVYPNCISRLFKLDSERDIAVVDVDDWGVGLVMLEKGELFMYSCLQPVNSLECRVLGDKSFEAAVEENESFAKGVDELAGFIRTYVNFFTSRHFGKNLDRIYMLGEPARVKGVESYFRDLLQVEVRAGYPPNRYFITLDSGLRSLDNNIEKSLVSYACNLGLLLRGA